MKTNFVVKMCVFFVVVHVCMPLDAMEDEEIDKISGKYSLNINSLKAYYYRLQLVSRYIFDKFCIPSDIDGMQNKLSAAIIPLRNQIEANGGVALEVYNGRPHGFWTPLGFLPICDGGTSVNCQHMKAIMDEVATTLRLSKLDGTVTNTWGSCNYVCKVGHDLAQVGFSDVQEVSDKRMIAPCDVHLIWSAVKPRERSVC